MTHDDTMKPYDVVQKKCAEPMEAHRFDAAFTHARSRSEAEELDGEDLQTAHMDEKRSTYPRSDAHVYKHAQEAQMTRVVASDLRKNGVLEAEDVPTLTDEH